MKYLTKDEQKEVYDNTIDGVIDAKSGPDLKVLIDIVKDIHWSDKGREMFLWGLIQGAVLQFNRSACIEELKLMFKPV